MKKITLLSIIYIFINIITLTSIIALPTGPANLIVDNANILSQADQTYIKQVQDRILKEHRIRIILVTITSLADYGPDMNYEKFSDAVLANWPQDYVEKYRPILILVEANNGNIEILLNSIFWKPEAAQVMIGIRKFILSKTKSHSYGEAILIGINKLDSLFNMKPSIFCFANLLLLLPFAAIFRIAFILFGGLHWSIKTSIAVIVGVVFVQTTQHDGYWLYWLLGLFGITAFVEQLKR